MTTTLWRPEKDRVFPFGVVERLWGGRIGATYNPINDLFGKLALGYDRLHNTEHQSGRDTQQLRVAFSVAYKIDMGL